MIPLRNVPGRNLRLRRTSPPPYRPKSRLTKKRREIIEEFKRANPKPIRGSSQLFGYMLRHDPRIDRSDVDRWIKANPWIRAKVEINVQETFRKPSPSPSDCSQLKRVEFWNRILNLKKIDGGLHFLDEDVDINFFLGYKFSNMEMKAESSGDVNVDEVVRKVHLLNKSKIARRSQTKRKRR